MKLAIWFGRILTQRLSPRELIVLAMEVWPHVWKQIPKDQRVDFLKSVAEKHLGTFLGDLNREERASLMNVLLPLVARELPLTELDFLTAFSSSGGDYQPQGSLSEDEP